jgi:sensor domain CHASE-containing protein
LGLAPGDVIQNVAPLAGNEKSIGFDQLPDAAQNKEAIKAVGAD